MVAMTTDYWFRRVRSTRGEDEGVANLVVGNSHLLDIFSAAVGEVAEWSKAALC